MKKIEKKIPLNLVSCSDDFPSTFLGECGINFEGMLDCGIGIPGFTTENIKGHFSL